jgi:hypothetical protein
MEKTLKIHLDNQRSAIAEQLSQCLNESLMLTSNNKWEKGWTVGMSKAIAIVKEQK